ncbi:Transposon Ty3-I Gag-Pol polyprotein [Biomphalaria glabrata]|nr:Transposon Ty3-I Gag-Pol polyprotein [Biomphalaria glabrata]
MLKDTLVSSSILAYPIPGMTFILDTDASNTGKIDGTERVIAYFSRSLLKAERNYCVTRRELLAVVDAIKHFHRWIERLQTYEFEIHHRKGLIHQNADALSRRPCKTECKHCKKVEEKEEIIDCQCLDLNVLGPWSDENIREDQLKDEDLATVLFWKERGQRPDWQHISEKGAAMKAYWAQWDSMVVENGVLKRMWESTDGTSTRLQIVLPKVRIQEVLQELHNGSTCGHLGINKTLEKVRQRFYWCRYKEDVEDWCRRCDRCAATKGPQRRTRGPLQQYNVGVPFERIALDIAGPFPETLKGNRYILCNISTSARDAHNPMTWMIAK